MPVGCGVDLWVEYGVYESYSGCVCMLVHGKEAFGLVVGFVVTINFRVYMV